MEQMSKRDWSLKDLRMAKTAMLKSLIEAGEIKVVDDPKKTVKGLVDIIYEVTPSDEKHLPQNP